ncbi:MAG: hypothetical protein ACK56I_25685, partial [bacterium]
MELALAEKLLQTLLPYFLLGRLVFFHDAKKVVSARLPVCCRPALDDLDPLLFRRVQACCYRLLRKVFEFSFALRIEIQAIHIAVQLSSDEFLHLHLR